MTKVCLIKNKLELRRIHILIILDQGNELFQKAICVGENYWGLQTGKFYESYGVIRILYATTKVKNFEVRERKKEFVIIIY